MQYGLLYLPIHTHGFAVSNMLDTDTTWSFVSQKLAEKLPTIIQTTTPLTIALPIGKTLIAKWATKLDMLVNILI